MPEERQEMVWTVTTHEHKERSTDWYWALGVIALASAVVSVFFHNILLAVIILLGAFSIGFLAARGPREHLVRIDARGLSIDGTRHPFSSVATFWVEHDTPQPRLYMTLKAILTPHFTLMLDDEEQGSAVREHLRQHIKEEEQGPHLGEHLAEIFGL